MSMEAQFYEALRRQRVIERRQSLGVARQVQQPKYQPRYIHQGVLREDDLHVPWSYNPLRRTKLASSEQNLSEKEKPPLQRSRPVMHGKLHKRFSSTDYMQQW